MTDLPVVGEAHRLLKLQGTVELGFLERKIALAQDSHAWAAAYLALWLFQGKEPESEFTNEFVERSRALARTVKAAMEQAPEPEPIQVRSRYYNPVQHRLVTPVHSSSSGGACYAEAGGLSIEARREQARAREGSGQYKGPRMVRPSKERCKLFSESYPRHWK